MGKTKTRAPDQTLREADYLNELSSAQTSVCIKLASNEEYVGKIEFFDTTFIRLTRTGGPNLFIYKNTIKYLHEADS